MNSNAFRSQIDFRVVIRNNTEFMVRAWTAYARGMGDVLCGVILNVVYVANVRHLPIGSDDADKAVFGQAFDQALLRPVSVHAVAASMNVPYETVRGMLSRMMDYGWCHRLPGGFVVDLRAMSTPPLIGIWHEICVNFTEMIDELRTLGVSFAVGGTEVNEGVLQPPLGMLSRIVMEFRMRQLEDLKPVYGDFSRGAILGAIICENVRPALTDPEFARRNDEHPVRDEERIPVSIRKIAQRLLMPYETTRRQVAALESVGAVRTISRGKVIVPYAAITAPGLMAYNARLANNFNRMLVDLHNVGFDFKRKHSERTFNAI